MWGVNERLQRQFDRAQAQYEAQTPPEWDGPPFDDDCEDGECGECQSCVMAAKEYAAEMKAEAQYDALHDR